MKNFLFLALMTVGVTVGAYAQEVSFGAKAGVNFASLSGNDAEEVGLDGKTGFHLGLVMDIGLGSKFSVQPEVLYSTLGAKVDNYEVEDEEGNVMSASVKFKLDYIAVPVMLKYYVVDGFSLQAGPQFSFNNNSELETGDGTNTVAIGLDDQTESFELGAAFGLGYELPVGLFFQGRYSRGFSDIFEGSDMRNNNIQLSAGYKF